MQGTSAVLPGAIRNNLLCDPIRASLPEWCKTVGATVKLHWRQQKPDRVEIKFNCRCHATRQQQVLWRCKDDSKEWPRLVCAAVEEHHGKCHEGAPAELSREELQTHFDKTIKTLKRKSEELTACKVNY